MTEKQTDNEEDPSAKPVDFLLEWVTPSRLAVFGFVTCLLVLSSVVVHFFLGFDIPTISIVNWGSAQYWGQLGDFLGGVLNPILSFLALIAVVISLRSQSKDVGEARADAKKANDRIDEQTRVFQHQNFETAFFGLVQLHQKNFDRVKAPDNEKFKLGRNEFEKIINQFNISRIDDGLDLSKVQSFGGVQYQQRQVLEYSKRFMDEVGHTMIHYFSSLEQILKYIEGPSRPAGVDLTQYLSIFKSLLSPEEAECLLMYALSEQGGEIKPFMLQYGLCDLVPRRARMGLAEQLLAL